MSLIFLFHKISAIFNDFNQFNDSMQASTAENNKGYGDIFEEIQINDRI